MFSKFCSIVFTTLQLKFKATGSTTTKVGIFHGDESTYLVVPVKFCRVLLWKEDSGRNVNHRNYPAVGIAPPYLTCFSVSSVLYSPFPFYASTNRCDKARSPLAYRKQKSSLVLSLPSPAMRAGRGCRDETART